MPPIKEEVKFGTITFTSTTSDPSGASVAGISKDITLNVTSVQTAPAGPVMQTRIYAWNGLLQEDYRAMVIVFNGEYDEFNTANTHNLNIRYYAGKIGSGDPDSFSELDFSSYVPAFHFVQGVTVPEVNVPIQFDQIQVKTGATNRKIVGSIDEIILGSTVLSNFNIQINSFGGNAIPLNHFIIFDLDGLPSGSFESQTFTCQSDQASKTGILQLKSEFTPDSRNPLASLTFDFTHHSNKLAYNGPVGKFDLVDGLGFTEIKVTAIDQNGKIYREQNNKGFEVVRGEKPWSQYFNGVSMVVTEGYILMEFEMELISSDGSKITITNGHAHYKTAA